MASVRLFGVLKQFSKSNINICKATAGRKYSVDSKPKNFTKKIVDDICILSLNVPNAKVNSLSRDVVKEFEELISYIKKDPGISAVVLISGKPDVFIAGADVTMLAGAKTKDEVSDIAKAGHAVLKSIENCKKPFIAAIKGSCLGGGLEVALSCHYRIAMIDKSTVFGLPEVELGLIPGGGGTQRLPKLVPLTDAIEMCTSGKRIKVEAARRLGLIDEVVYSLGPGLKSKLERSGEYLEEVAIFFAKQISSGKLKIDRHAKKSPVQKVTDHLFSFDFVKNMIFKKAEEEIQKKTKGFYPAPLKALEVLKKGIEDPKEGFEAEINAFSEMAMTPQSKGLMSLFFGIMKCKKNKYGKPPKRAENVGILGAGLMGAGIARVTIDKQIHCVLKDVSDKSLYRGYGQIQKSLGDAVKRKRHSSLERDLILTNLVPTLNYDSLKNSDIVIEAVFEDLNIKHKVIKEVEAVVPPHCVIATNTSALPLSQIAEASRDQSKVIGMHYFSPVEKMQLLEIVITKKTSKETAAVAVDLGLRQGKVVIVVEDSPGFYTTRTLCAMFAEALRFAQEGIDPLTLDSYTQRFGFPVGCATLVDEIGFDIGVHISTFLEETYGARFFGGETQILKDLVNAGFLGRKSGKGWYTYAKGKKEKKINMEAMKILESYRNPVKMENTEEECTMRLVSRFVNESVLCLQEGIVHTPVEGDVGSVFGLGFPPFHGGVFRWLDTFGCDKLVAYMEKFQNFYGSSFAPCDLLLDHAKDPSKKFHKN